MTEPALRPASRARAVAFASSSASATVLSRRPRSSGAARLADAAPVAVADTIFQRIAEARSWPVAASARLLRASVEFDQVEPVGHVVVDVPSPCSAARVAKSVGVALAVGDTVSLALPRGAAAPVVDYFRELADRLPEGVLVVRLRGRADERGTARVVIGAHVDGLPSDLDEGPDWLVALVPRFTRHRTATAASETGSVARDGR